MALYGVSLFSRDSNTDLKAMKLGLVTFICGQIHCYVAKAESASYSAIFTSISWKFTNATESERSGRRRTTVMTHTSVVVRTLTSNIPPQPHRCIIIRWTDKTVYELKNHTLHRREPADVPREPARGLCAVAVLPVSRTIHLENLYYSPPPRVLWRFSALRRRTRLLCCYPAYVVITV